MFFICLYFISVFFSTFLTSLCYISAEYSFSQPVYCLIGGADGAANSELAPEALVPDYISGLSRSISCRHISRHTIISRITPVWTQ